MSWTLDVPGSAWLDRLLGEVDQLAAALATATPDAATIDRQRDLAAVATLRLDGSPITDVPADIPPPPPGLTTGPARGGWLEVLRSGAGDLGQVPDEVLMAIEHRGAREGLDAAELGAQLSSDLLPTMATLHGRVTDGLLHPDVAGAPRRSDQAVHDASLGRVIFFPIDIAHLPARFEALATWLAHSDAHPVVRAGVLHHQMLDLHPYEAANGRTARIAERLLLAHQGIDTAIVGQPEQAHMRDVIGYLDDVARARRLGSPAVFVARVAEAIADGLRSAASTLGVAEAVEVPAATLAFLAERGTAPFTIVEHRTATTGGKDADAGLDAALAAGAAVRLHGSTGLRWAAVAAG